MDGRRKSLLCWRLCPDSTIWSRVWTCSLVLLYQFLMKHSLLHQHLFSGCFLVSQESWAYFLEVSLCGSDCGGWAGQALPLLQAAFPVPSKPCYRASMHRTAFVVLLWHTSDAMRPDARTRQGSRGPGADPELCPASLLCCQAAFGQCCWQGAPELLPAHTQLQGSWHSPAGHPVSLQSRAHCHTQHLTAATPAHTDPFHPMLPFKDGHTAREDGEIWSLPCSMQCLIQKDDRRSIWKRLVFPIACIAVTGVTRESQKHQGAILALHWIVHAPFRPGL